MPVADGALPAPIPSPARLEVEWVPAHAGAALEHEWRRLEAAAEDLSFFLSWDWVGPLLQCVPEDARPELIRVHRGPQTVALALVGRSVVRRHKVLRSRARHWNETGRPDVDAITLEHNGILALPGQKSEALAAVICHLAARPGWDELFVGGLPSDAQPAWAEAASQAGLLQRERWRASYFYIDLERVRGGDGGFVGTLSANARQQIRRAMRLYAERGSLGLQRARSIEEARTWLDELITVHQAYWAARGQPGAFASAFARQFHAAVVEAGWARGAVEIGRITTGDRPIGYLYNFRSGDTLYNYQTGFHYEDDAKLKPGLVCHVLAADDATQRNLNRYDLMMGGGHYKQRLANAEGQMLWCVIQQPRILLKLENALRDLVDARARQRKPVAGEAEGAATDANHPALKSTPS